MLKLEKGETLEMADEVKSMNTSDSHCQPSSFPFPFQPYDVQVNFMKDLYATLQEGKIGIFESPTGTGKSLSLICGALAWLKNYQQQKKENLQKELSSTLNLKDDNDDWFSSYAQKKEQAEILQKVRNELEFITKQEERLNKLKNSNKRKRSKSSEDSVFDELFKDAKHIKEAIENELKNDSDDNREFILDDYISDKEEEKDFDNDEEEEERHILKIFYCSRTHSQLSQFVHEVQRSPYKNNIRVVSLGSRQNLCINAAVQKMKNLSLMNEKCTDLLQNKKTSSLTKVLKDVNHNKRHDASKCGCPFYSQRNMNDMKDNLLMQVQDIEQIVELGKKSKACPYYTTRYSIPEAELVVLPYNILLNKQARSAYGIRIKDNVVLIDEAHNLLEVLNNIHSSEVTGLHLSQTYSQLKQYQKRYYSRLNPKNLMYIKQILFIITSFIKHLGGNVDSLPKPKSTVQPQIKMLLHDDFLSSTGVDNINLFKILRYCERSKIGQKLHGFMSKNQVSIATKNSSETTHTPSVFFFNKAVSALNTSKENSNPTQENILSSPFILFQEFLRALTNPSHDGRILSNRQDTLQQSSLKYFLLNPSMQFQEIVKEARSIVIAGGTMQPISEFIHQLFLPAGVAEDQIVHFSCGHVIPPDNLLAVALSHGPGGKALDFTFQNRNNAEIMDELGRVLLNLCTIIPGGLVCFFPSYDYEQQIYNHWEKTGVINRINKRKQIFCEPRKSNQVDKVLGDYTKCIALCKENQKLQQTGAILLSIVGGKMSEGINFADDLGRCVIMIGLPYPNVNSPELKEKMEYLNKTAKGTSQKSAGQVYYENLCMKAVNQSIGRAIRHRGDYATIVLLDGRYQRPTVSAALPTWIVSRLKSFPQFGPAFSAIRQFFNEKNKKF